VIGDELWAASRCGSYWSSTRGSTWAIRAARSAARGNELESPVPGGELRGHRQVDAQRAGDGLINRDRQVRAVTEAKTYDPSGSAGP
jgi:hypothetical protein